jgi:hypothetical protein
MRQGKPCSDRKKAPVQGRRSCLGASREHSARPKKGQSGQSTALRSNEHFAQDLPIPIVLLNWQLEILFRNREGLDCCSSWQNGTRAELIKPARNVPRFFIRISERFRGLLNTENPDFRVADLWTLDAFDRIGSRITCFAAKANNMPRSRRQLRRVKTENCS